MSEKKLKHEEASIANNSVTVVPSRYASIVKRKIPQNCNFLAEYYEFLCSDDNASITSLPVTVTSLETSKSLINRRICFSKSMSKLPLLHFQKLDCKDSMILEPEETNQINCDDPVEMYYFLPSKVEDKASKEWALLESTGQITHVNGSFSNFHLDQDNEKTKPLCLKKGCDFFRL